MPSPETLRGNVKGWGAVPWISTGAIAGALSRYIVSNYSLTLWSRSFAGTLLINVSGSLLIGFILAFYREQRVVDPRWRFLLATGFLGAYTTFSTFSYDTVALANDNALTLALLNAVASPLLGLLAALAGYACASLIIRHPKGTPADGPSLAEEQLVE